MWPIPDQGAGSSQPILEKWLPQRSVNRCICFFAGLHELYRSEESVPSGKLTGRNGISPFSIGNTIFIQDPFRLVDTGVYATGAYVSSHSDPLQNAHLAPTHPAQVVKTQAALNPGIIGNLSPRRKCTPTSMSNKLWITAAIPRKCWQFGIFRLICFICCKRDATSRIPTSKSS